MRIGELARRTGVSVRSLRHYEKTGLLPGRRLANGYRSFGPEAVDRVRKIQLLLSTGFSLADIDALLPCFEEGFAAPLCDRARERYRERLEEIDRRIDALEEVRSRIVQLMTTD
jgi:MerR family transcriptional regulator, copper efflux regulator